jgi:hypothetical protein
MDQDLHSFLAKVDQEGLEESQRYARLFGAVLRWNDEYNANLDPFSEVLEYLKYLEA